MKEYKCAKARLDMILKQSQDIIVREATPFLVMDRNAIHHQQMQSHPLDTGIMLAKYNMEERVLGNQAHLVKWQHQPTCGGRDAPIKNKSTITKAISQTKQDSWVRWEGIDKKITTCKDLWNMVEE